MDPLAGLPDPSPAEGEGLPPAVRAFGEEFLQALEQRFLRLDAGVAALGEALRGATRQAREEQAARAFLARRAARQRRLVLGMAVAFLPLLAAALLLLRQGLQG
jgi:hypothetical protein